MHPLLLLAASAAAMPAVAPPARPLPARPLPDRPLVVTTRILVERRTLAPDGTVRIVAAPGARAKPGDRLVVTLAYRNIGRQPIADLVLADPVPAALAYQAADPASPVPEVSVDGRRFAALAALSVALPGGGERAAASADVVAVRWRLPAPLAPGAGGTLAFRAVLR